MLGSMDVDHVARLALAASNVTRLHVLRLSDGRRSLGEIAQEIGVGPSSVSHHVRLLVAAGLVEVGRRGHRHVLRRLPGPWIALARALG